MDTSTNTHAKIRKSPKVRKDRSLVIPIAIVVVVAIIAAVPLIWALNLHYEYRNYIDELRDDFIKGERFDTIDASYNDTEVHLNKDQASELFRMISVSGMGKKCDPKGIPEDEGVFIDLGHGTTLFIAHTTITIEYEEEVPGIYLEYTYKDGRKYCYESEKIFFYNIENILEK